MRVIVPVADVTAVAKVKMKVARSVARSVERIRAKGRGKGRGQGGVAWMRIGASVMIGIEVIGKGKEGTAGQTKRIAMHEKGTEDSD